ncbi:transcriptional regulator, CdaR [Pseudonocardia dioxanivorans CB1190]|uniref:Transcriptional regulator, CdaR n=2 Tax=Pseudonocardiaceae TaxID=2070 RepID=F4CJ92_PSEUX|nr:transcriptional regulator, CdaR [Pseudonocardia dioxanivorans CB1190]
MCARKGRTYSPRMAAPGSTASTPPVPSRVPVAHALRRPAGDEAAVLRRVVSMCGHLSALAAQNTELADVVTFLAEGVGAGVVVLDRRLDELARAGLPGGDDLVGGVREQAGVAGLRTVLAAAARTRRALTVPGSAAAGAATVVAPVSVGDDVSGYLLTASHAGSDLTEDMRLLVTEHAAMVCGVVLGRELVVTAAAGRARQELVEGLLLVRDRDDPEVERWAQHLGFEPGRGYCAVAVSLAGDRAATAFPAVETALGRLAPEAIVAARADEIVAIVPATAGGAPGRGVAPGPLATARAVAAGCVAAMSGRAGASVPVAVGVGNPCDTAAEIARSYAEARHALAASEKLGEFGGVTAFADLGIHRLLLRVPDVTDLRDFAEEVVGALLAEERTGGMEYLATLSAYFEHNNSPRRAAEKLHVHPNTVSYRIRRIEEITGLSLDVRRDRLMAEVAVEILDALGDRAGGGRR